MHTAPNREQNTPPRLMAYIERIERLEEDKKAIMDGIKSVKLDCRSDGYDTKIVNQMLRERRMTAEQREYWISMCEVYRANLGMLNGTPLGESARRRFENDSKEEARAPDQEDEAPQAPETALLERRPEKTVEDARQDGREAAKQGKRIFDNPYLASDARRAAWDEGFCEELGHDGMELPAALRRAEKPKKAKGAGKAGEGEGK